MRLFALAGLLLMSLLLSGCGGSSGPGNNSKIVVHLTRFVPSQDLTTFELYLTNAGNTTLDTTNLQGFASTTNKPNWIDDYSATNTSSELTIRYTTLGVNAPNMVFVKVPKTANTTEKVNLQIDVDGVPGPVKTATLTSNATSRLVGVQINRNDAVY